MSLLLMLPVVACSAKSDGEPLSALFESILPRCSDTSNFESKVCLGGSNPLLDFKTDQGRAYRPAKGTYYTENRIVARMERHCANETQGFVTNIYEFRSNADAVAFLKKEETDCDKASYCNTFVPKALEKTASFDYRAGRYSLFLAPSVPAIFTMYRDWNSDGKEFGEEFGAEFVHGEFVVHIAAFYRDKHPGYVAAISDFTTDRTWSFDGLILTLAQLVLQRWQ